MRLRSGAEPPVYHMDRFDLIFMVVIGIVTALFVEGALLYWSHFDDALLFAVGAYWSLYVWPAAYRHIRSEREFRRYREEFRKEMDNHEL